MPMLWAAFVAIAAVGFAQETAPADAGVVIRSTTSLVQVRVVAEDSRGRSVTDRQRDDFQVQDDRKPQPLTLFTAERSTLPASVAAFASTGDSEDTAPAAGT